MTTTQHAVQQDDYTMASLPAFIGKELGVSEWMEVPQATIEAFANCTGDRQWIHVDVDRAANESPFGGTVAHGYLTLSLLSGAVVNMGVVPRDALAAFNYGVDRLRFITPVKAGSRIRSRIALAEVTDQGAGRQLVKMSNTVEIEGSPKPALIAEMLALFVGNPK